MIQLTQSQIFRQKVQVWIHMTSSQNQRYFLLLLTRPERKSFWQPVTGSVEKGESLIAAAEREATEETGLSFTEKPREIDQPFEFESRGESVIEYGFALQVAPSGQNEFPQVILDPHEHVDYRWVQPQEALGMVKYPSNREMLEALLAGLSENPKS